MVYDDLEDWGDLYAEIAGDVDKILSAKSLQLENPSEEEDATIFDILLPNGEIVGQIVISYN